MACQVVYQVFAPTQDNQINVINQTVYKATATALPPTSTPLPSPLPTITPTPTAIPSPTTAPTASPVQFAVFEDLWTNIRDFYLYADFNGLDWDAVYDEYYQRISNGLNDQNFYTAMADMVASLGDDHSIFIDPQQVLEEDESYAGVNDYVGIGIVSSAIPERMRVTVVLVFPDSRLSEPGSNPTIIFWL